MDTFGMKLWPCIQTISQKRSIPMAGTTLNPLGKLFPGVAIVLCFLHSVLDIQQRCRKTKTLWRKLTVGSGMSTQPRVSSILPNAYAIEGVGAKNVKQPSTQRLLNLKENPGSSQVAHDYPKGARTSNMLNRLMNHQDRLLL